MTDFSKLQLKKPVLQALVAAKLTSPFEVQEKIIPLAVQGKNLVFTSRTGSGKTLAYFLGFVGKINPRQDIQMLIVVPTRELCIQVTKEIKTICDHLNISVGMLYGGREMKGDWRTLTKKNQIIVATPGRLVHHINDKRIKIGDVKYLVYDEADQLFDDGFFQECGYLRDRVSKLAQVILCTATMTDNVRQFVEEEIGTHDFLEIGSVIPKNIIQEKLYCDKLEKNTFLLKLLSNDKFKRVLIFCNTKVKSQSIADFFVTNNISAISLNGNLEQKERQNHLNLFKQGRIRILVATDVAARGLHIEAVDVVINYDVPTRDEFYVHRIGRTGRVDKPGYSLTLICPEDVDRFRFMSNQYDLVVKDIN